MVCFQKKKKKREGLEGLGCSLVAGHLPVLCNIHIQEKKDCTFFICSETISEYLLHLLDADLGGRDEADS